MRVKKFTRHFVMAVCFLVSICFGPGNALVQAQNVIKIGASKALTGPAATFGVGARRAAMIAVDEINAKGGVRGKKLELICLDSEHLPVKTIANYKRLVEMEKCVALLGDTNSASNLALAQLLNDQLKVPCICSSDATKITENEAWEKGLPNYMFRYGMYGRGQSRAMLRFAMEKFGHKKIAFLTWTAGWGVTGRGELRERMKEIGMEPVADETYDSADTDMTPQLMKIKASKADIILNYGLPRENVYVVRTKDKIGDTTVYMGAHALATQSFWEAAGDFAEGVLATTWVTADGPQPEKMQKFLDKYYEKYGRNLEAITATIGAYDKIYLFAQVIDKVGTDPKAIRDGLENVSYFSGLTKEFKRPLFTKDRHEALIWDQDFILCRWTSGKFLEVKFDEKGPFVMVSAGQKRYMDKRTGKLN